jgi:hypothetical protein
VRSALPPRARPLAGPAAGALRSGAEQLTLRALARPRVQEAWEASNRQAHRQLLRVIDGGSSAVSTRQGVVSLNLKTMLEQIASRTGVGSRVAAKLPPSAATIVILRSDQLEAAQDVAHLLKPLALVLVLLALACFGGAVALARGRRRQTLRACGMGLVVAGVAALVARKLGGSSLVDALATTETVRPAVQASWDIGTSLLQDVAIATIAYGVLVVAGAWLAGPTRVAVALRGALAPYLRDARIAYGAAALIVLLVLLWGPTEGTQRLLPSLVLIALFLAGVEALRRQVAAEFADLDRAGGLDLTGIRDAARRTRDRWSTPRGGDAEAPGGGAVAQLDRLVELHGSGALDDAEFTAAKERVLSGR